MTNEFLSTNIKGGYASYDLIRGNIRKYHGLLIAGMRGLDRLMVVTSLNESIEIDGKEYNFSGNIYKSSRKQADPNNTNPEPDFKKYLRKAYFLPFPTQIFKINSEIKIKKQIEFNEYKNKVKVTYEISTPEEIILRLQPLVTNRDFHKIGLHITLDEIHLQNSDFMQRYTIEDKLKLFMQSDLKFEEMLDVSRNHFYPLEQDRGYEASEDLIIAGKYSTLVPAGVHQHQITFLVPERIPRIRKVFMMARDLLEPTHNHSIVSDINRFKTLHPEIDENFQEFLIFNARKFIVKEENRNSMVAGYHWFGEWSRDLFISFKGIFLSLGRFHEAQRVLTDWSNYISIGLLPNTMEGMHYNSIDGILWYFVAIWHYWNATKDRETIKYLLPKLERVVYAFARGSKYGISIDDKGYLAWSNEEKALTWMDAKVDDKPVINRAGACVEIQALWYNALQILEKLSILVDYKPINIKLLDNLEKLIEDNFEKDFWNKDAGYYNDYIDLEGEANSDLRPNQLFLYALPFRLGKLDNFKKVNKVVEDKLLTNLGLRTLSPDDPKFIQDYKGDQKTRDLAYHQGIVWPWLLLPYYLANIYSENRSIDAKRKVRNHLEKVWTEIQERNLITLPEIFSGPDFDLEPRGTISQAWSIAALLEAIMSLYE